MSTFCLVSCVSRKRARSAAAKDLYTSDWFAKARAYVERISAPWFILSVEYGLLSPETEIAPYERTLNTMSVSDRRMWAAGVLRQLRPRLAGVERVVLLAGARYREFLVDSIRDCVPVLEVPLEGLHIGEQLGWFKRTLES